LLRIRCSAGAYIRSLAHDLGIALGTHALLAGLRREAVGSFTLADAHSMAAIQEAAQAGQVSTLLLPPGERLPLPAVTFPPETLRRLGYGQIVPIAVEDAAGEAEFVQVRDPDGQLAGIARRLSLAAEEEDSPPAWLWKAEKWLL
jgi:tRNA pseudouridine55 synthase